MSNEEKSTAHLCNAPKPDSDARCELHAGHPGPHAAMADGLFGTWSDDATPRAPEQKQ